MPGTGPPNEQGFSLWCTVPVRIRQPTSVPPEMFSSGSRRLHTWSKNQCQGVSVQGSPLEQVMRTLERSWRATASSP